MKVSEIMSSDPIVVAPDKSLRDTAAMMADVDVGFLLVGEGDELVGMVTDRDICVRGVGGGMDLDNPVREVMTGDVRYCFDTDECEAIVQNMGEEQVRRMPVVNSDKRLVGVLSVGDIAVRDVGTKAGQALSGIAQPGGAHN